MLEPSYALGMLCGLQGRVDEAVEWFAEARSVVEQQGARPLRARIDFHEARMFLRRDASRDRARAAGLLHAALEQFHTIGMTGWARRAEEMLATATEDRPAIEVEGPQPASLHETFRKQGPIWTITYRGQTFGLPHVRGLADLQQLVLTPGGSSTSRRSSHSTPMRHPARV